MRKAKPIEPADRYEVIDDAKVKEAVELFVDFAEKHKMQAKLVLIAMEHIVDKIKNYLQVETVNVHDASDKVH